MISLPSIVSMTRNCPIPSPISLILAINGCQLASKSPMSAQTCVRSGVEVDAVGNALQFGVGRCEVWKILRARLGGPGGSAAQGFTIAIDHPAQQAIDDVGVHSATTASPISLPVERTLLDLQIACVGDGLRHIEQ